MSVQGALQFIRRAREDEAIRGRIQALDAQVNLEDLVKIGAEDGFEFTSEELQTAYKLDWSMRWFHYSSKHRLSGDDPNTRAT